MMEAKFLFFLQDLQNPVLDAFFIFLTIIGEYGAIWIIISVFLFFLHRKKALLLGASLAITGFLSDQLKSMIARSRPPESVVGINSPISNPESYSFPSIHTSLSFTAAVMLHYFFPKLRIYIWPLAILTSFSRLYLTVHYPSDIVAGALIGTAIALLLIVATKRFVP
ncbi:phosphatase PAP2 family protein [Paenalkalicoccus suaedae]|uniref:Phosphatase PAP2 family protein n=1 Tax=Paenalkalicoccus suaedae TaxID=2592382 RepID=A0A859FD83_9BACI|nr:phosphatase PAP2 family protein [Paenalkalicoccus suaedae]QKS71179.1 phosphatase PAP2 family protein [Paenalkalicoccus suaedae]